MEPGETPQFRVRVLLADDHPEMLRVIRKLLTPEFDVVGSAGDGPSLVEMARQLRPDAIVTDLKMPGISGIEAARRILQEGTCGLIILVTMHSEPVAVNNVLQAGIRGYVSKTTAPEELIPALRTVLQGGVFISASIRQSRRGVLD